VASIKERIDLLLVEQGYFDSREKAKAAIMAGLVFTNEELVDKPGMKVERIVNIKVKGSLHPYVSRGGLKLAKALQFFHINLQDQVVIDIGASTGGFTDCALQHGAKYVYAIDVGHNQLAWSIRNDARVNVMERTNFRYMQPSDLQGLIPTFATIDVSFISLKLIFPTLRQILLPNSQIVGLIKPQFEAGKEHIGKSGVLRDAKIHQEVLTSIVSFASQCGFHLNGITYSPITGAEGNIEFLAYWTLEAQLFEEQQIPFVSLAEWKEQIRHVVDEAHRHYSS
jgi:23S rRNA (cytidine1920-2'-O)/16S rRNA (cytidine1409-2'-O)-methyltransferase